jgi:alanine racemase
VLAVIKANGYGHGLVTVAHTLQAADGVAVARIEEALQLREAGIGGRIVVLGGFVHADEVQAGFESGLEFVVHDIRQVELLEGLAPRGSLGLWLKVDTGMGRLGFPPDTVAETRQRLQSWPGCETLRLMTHFACADEPDSEVTASQTNHFRAASQGWQGDVSLSNSAAILQWPQSLARAGGDNWVRPGLMLYGASPFAGRSAESLGLQPVMEFETRLIAVKKIPRGHRVGYGGDWCASRDSIVGVAAAGYADGYPWHVSHGTPVLVHGRRVELIGRVSMDMISIDLTDGPAAAPGDRVVLWGEGLPVEEVARCAATIPYALLTGVSPRVLRAGRE